MYPHVPYQMRLIRKQFATNTAKVCFHFVQNAQFASMTLHMRYQITALWKSLFANGTGKRPFTCMRAFMYYEDGAVRESFVTNRAPERLVSRVKSHVQ